MADSYSAISVFDLDKTLIRVSSPLEFTKFLLRKGALSKRGMLCIFLLYACYKVFPLILPLLHTLAFNVVFRGKDLKSLEDLAEQFWEKNLEKSLNRPVYNCLKEAKAKGHLTVLLSNSPDFFIKIAARRLDFDFSQGSAYYLVDGCLDKVSRLMGGEEKAEELEKFLKEYDIPRENSTAYTDCISDLPLLKKVVHPVAVNPNKQLKKYCKQKGWKVILDHLE